MVESSLRKVEAWKNRTDLLHLSRPQNLASNSPLGSTFRQTREALGIIPIEIKVSRWLDISTDSRVGEILGNLVLEVTSMSVNH